MYTLNWTNVGCYYYWVRCCDVRHVIHLMFALIVTVDWFLLTARPTKCGYAHVCFKYTKHSVFYDSKNVYIVSVCENVFFVRLITWTLKKREKEKVNRQHNAIMKSTNQLLYASGFYVTANSTEKKCVRMSVSKHEFMVQMTISKCYVIMNIKRIITNTTALAYRCTCLIC